MKIEFTSHKSCHPVSRFPVSLFKKIASKNAGQKPPVFPYLQVIEISVNTLTAAICCSGWYIEVNETSYINNKYVTERFIARQPPSHERTSWGKFVIESVNKQKHSWSLFPYKSRLNIVRETPGSSPKGLPIGESFKYLSP